MTEHPMRTQPDPPAGTITGKGTRRVAVERGGPVLVQGPVEIAVEGGEPLLVDRFLVAVCACGRSGRYPLCDGSHRAAAGSGQPRSQ
jgi:CDGSH-type Zn-finger protein